MSEHRRLDTCSHDGHVCNTLNGSGADFLFLFVAYSMIWFCVYERKKSAILLYIYKYSMLYVELETCTANQEKKIRAQNSLPFIKRKAFHSNIFNTMIRNSILICISVVNTLHAHIWVYISNMWMWTFTSTFQCNIMLHCSEINKMALYTTLFIVVAVAAAIAYTMPSLYSNQKRLMPIKATPFFGSTLHIGWHIFSVKPHKQRQYSFTQFNWHTPKIECDHQTVQRFYFIHLKTFWLLIFPFAACFLWIHFLHDKTLPWHDMSVFQLKKGLVIQNQRYSHGSCLILTFR